MTTNLTVGQPRELALPDSATLEQELKAVRVFQSTVKKLLIQGHDYGVIPGTQKPTLLKPGAEKIDKILHLADTYEVLNQIEEWQKGFFHYEFKCRLIIIGTDVVVSEGMGSCNSMENKYRYRWVFESALPKDVDKESLPTKKVRVKGNWTPTYRIENENPQDLANTILKMAKKRAHIDATLSAGRLSDVFTQDIEDMTMVPDIMVPDIMVPGIIDEPEPATEKVEPKPAKNKKVNEPEQQVATDIETSEQVKSPIDLSWLEDSLPRIKWPDKTVISWLRSKVNYQGLDFTGSLSDIIMRMNKEQAEFLVKEIETRLEMQ